MPEENTEDEPACIQEPRWWVVIGIQAYIMCEIVTSPDGEELRRVHIEVVEKVCDVFVPQRRIASGTASGSEFSGLVAIMKS
jgi:hypothetical protein